MSKRVSFLALIAGAILSACATSNRGPETFFHDGFTASPVGADGFFVAFVGNSSTSADTIQAYWLYDCAVLALSRGYQGFEVASGSLKVTGGAKDALDIVYTINPNSALQDNIRMLNAPFTANPPRSYNAAALKMALEPVVNGKKCGVRNVCPHDHSYLRPATAGN
jgi:hypothetical protein